MKLETVKQMELIYSLSNGKKENSLLTFFSKPSTKQGSIFYVQILIVRMLINNIQQPLSDAASITIRINAVKTLITNKKTLFDLTGFLTTVQVNFNNVIIFRMVKKLLAS